jgi:hypothetical protein
MMKGAPARRGRKELVDSTKARRSWQPLDHRESESNIVAFTVLATVFNNLPSIYQAGIASNSHYEVQGPMPSNYAGTMRQTRISAEFAIANTSLLPSGSPPYYLDPVSGGKYWIEAVNEPERAWYCWTPGDPQYNPQGAYQVPTWVLGDIATNGVAV